MPDLRTCNTPVFFIYTLNFQSDFNFKNVFFPSPISESNRVRKSEQLFSIWTSLICTQWHVMRDKLRMKRHEPHRWWDLEQRSMFFFGILSFHTENGSETIQYDRFSHMMKCVKVYLIWMHGLQRHLSLEFIVLRKFFKAHWYTRLYAIHSYQNDGTKSGSALSV